MTSNRKHRRKWLRWERLVAKWSRVRMVQLGGPASVRLIHDEARYRSARVARQMAEQYPDEVQWRRCPEHRKAS